MLFNKEVTRVKTLEKVQKRHHRPIYFRYYDKGKKKGKVVFEIEGGGQSIESMFIRKNEENFFHFLNEISDKRPSEKESNVVCKRRKTRVVPKNSARRFSLISKAIPSEKESSVSGSSAQDLIILEK